jgi:cation-transporting ATPase 13A2
LKKSNLVFTQSQVIIQIPTTIEENPDEILTTERILKNVIDLDPMEIEQELVFIGLLLFENPIKESTSETIEELKRNYMNQLIITGDNVYTAVNVAYYCGIIEEDQDLIIGSLNSATSKIQLQEFNADQRIDLSKKPKTGEVDWELSAMSSKVPYSRRLIAAGNIIDQILNSCINENKKIALDAKCFQFLHRTLQCDHLRLEKLMSNTVVYGRASTEQKEMIVEVYKELLGKKNQCIAFVGDGSNDCRALKAANVGLSIGNDESSFAASFTSTRINISPIIDIIIEGKACLANAVQNFKFLMISNLMVCFGIYLLNYKKLAINQFDYLYSFIFSFPFAFFMTLGRTKRHLNCLRLEPTLLTKQNLVPFLLHLVLIFLFLCFSVILLSEFSVYKTVEEVIGDYNPSTFDIDNHYFVENKLIFFFMSTMMIINAVACYAGFPFKVSFIKNPFVAVYSVITILFVIFNIFAESILDGYLLRIYVRSGRQPIYQPRQLKRFWLASGLVYFVIIFLNTLVERVGYYKQLKKIRNYQKLQRAKEKKDDMILNMKSEETEF